MLIYPLVWSSIPTSEGSGILLLRAVTSEGRDVLLSLGVVREYRCEMEIEPSPSIQGMLLYNSGASHITYNNERGVLTLLYHNVEYRPPFTGITLASDIVPEQRCRYRNRYDIDISLLPRPLPCMNEPLLCYLKWYKLRPYCWMELGENEDVEITPIARPTIMGKKRKVVYYRRIPSSLHSMVRSTTFTAAVAFIPGESESDSKCHIWYSGTIEMGRIGSYIHSVHFHRCNSTSSIDSAFNRWLTYEISPHLLIYHRRAPPPTVELCSVSCGPPYHAMDLQRYFLRYMPHLHSHQLPQLSRSLLGRERYGLGTTQQAILSTSPSSSGSQGRNEEVGSAMRGEGSGGARLVEYSINECHLLRDLWETLHLESQVEERANLLCCDFSSLWKLEDHQLLRLVCYNSFELGDDLPSQFTSPPFLRQLEGPFIQVMYCEYRTSLLEYYKREGHLPSSLISRIGALPLNLAVLLLHTIAPTTYFHWWEYITKILEPSILLQCTPHHMLLKEGPLLVSHLYTRGECIIPVQRWEVLIFLDWNSTIGLSEGVIVRNGTHDLCLPAFELQREMIDRMIRNTFELVMKCSNSQGERVALDFNVIPGLEPVPLLTLEENNITFRGSALDAPYHDLALNYKGSMPLLWIRGEQQPTTIRTRHERNEEEVLPPHLQVDIPRYQRELQRHHQLLLLTLKYRNQ